MADQFELDHRQVLHYVSYTPRRRQANPELMLRLVVPSSLRQDVLHMCHNDAQSGLQGVNRTYDRLRQEYYWQGMFQDVQTYIKECVDCSTGKGKPTAKGESPGNIVAEYPFEVVSMDFVTDLPASYRGNTRLLLFQCTFSGFNLCKPMSSWSAEDVARAYNEVVFQRFGASAVIRHDREPAFMSKVFAAFRQLMGSQQRATLAYRPQANGQQERAVQTVMQTIRAYVADPTQRDWDDLAENLMFALNTSYDHTRQDTPFYLVHGWDPKNTLTAMLTSAQGGDSATSWRRQVQRMHEYAMAMAREVQVAAKAQRAEAHNKALADRPTEDVKVGDAVWLYMARVKPGLTKKLAHLWHGPFRVIEKRDKHMVKLRVEGVAYRFFPWVHVSRLKLRREHPDRPNQELQIQEEDDFDAALLPEDSWDADEQEGEYEVEGILDVDWYKPTRTSRRVKKYLIKWTGYDEPEWIDASQLNCGRLLYEFDRSETAKARLAAMQAEEVEL